MLRTVIEIRFLRHFLLCACAINLSSLATAARASDAVIVRPAGWSAAVKPWKIYRQSQGHQIFEIDAGMGRTAIKAAIAEQAQASQGRLRFVLLAGDVTSPDRAAVNVPTFHHPSSAMVQFGGEPVLASDNDYGDLDGDNSPEFAVGRIPADSPEQLSDALSRVITYEQQRDFSAWRRNVHVVAGVGGFGAVTDSVIELTTRRFLADRIPGWFALSMTQASLQSNYCPDPQRFSDTCIGRMNEGGMFWVYIGHGHVKTLDYLQAGDEYLPIMTNEHVATVNTAGRAPIAVFLACYTGAYDAIEDSLAERLVMSDNGPIAAIAASRISGPYGLAMLSDGMLESCFDLQTETLGEVVMNAKRNLLDDARWERTNATSNQLGMINAIADALTPPDYDLRAERLEHVWQVNLLGDPMLRLSHPANIELEVNAVAIPGETLCISGNSNSTGTLTLELARCRGQVSEEVRQLNVGLTSAAARDCYQTRYLAANECRLAVEHAECLAGPFSLNLAIPPDLPRGKYCVRLFQQSETGWQVGYKEIKVRPSAAQ